MGEHRSLNVKKKCLGSKSECLEHIDGFLQHTDDTQNDLHVLSMMKNVRRVY